LVAAVAAAMVVARGWMREERGENVEEAREGRGAPD